MYWRISLVALVALLGDIRATRGDDVSVSDRDARVREAVRYLDQRPLSTLEFGLWRLERDLDAEVWETLRASVHVLVPRSRDRVIVALEFRDESPTLADARERCIAGVNAVRDDLALGPTSLDIRLSRLETYFPQRVGSAPPEFEVAVDRLFDAVEIQSVAIVRLNPFSAVRCLGALLPKEIRIEEGGARDARRFLYPYFNQ